MRPHIILLLLLFLVADSTVYAQSGSPVIYSEKNAVYQQNFNELPNGGSFTLIGKGPHLFAQSPFVIPGLSGWEFMHKSGTGTNAVFMQGAGTSTSSGMYSVGTSGSTDRALGSLAAGTGVYAFGILFTNQTGGSLNKISGSFSAEQWRKGGSGNRNTWMGKYATGTMNSIDQPNLLNHTSMNFSSIQFTTGAGSLNGNSPENFTNIQFTITGIDWKNGEQLLLRWEDVDETGSDDLVAIDNFSFSANFDTSNNTVSIDSLYSLAPQPSNAEPIQISFSSPNDSLLKTGDTLQLNLLFSESVHLDTSSSINYLPITISNNNRQAVYKSGNYTNQIRFNYIIQKGEKDIDGISIANNFNPNQLMIKDQAENLATINLLSTDIQYIKVDGSNIQFRSPADTLLTQCNNRDSIDISNLLAIDSTVVGEELNWQIIQAPIHWFSSFQNYTSVSNGSITSPNAWKIYSQMSSVKDSMVIRVSNGTTSANKKLFFHSTSWLGNTDSSWHNPQNWCNATIPSDSAIITISANTGYQPAISGVHNVKQLHLLTGAKLQITGTLKISEMINGDSLSVDATQAILELNGNKNQSIDGRLFKEHRIQGFIVKNNSGIQITHRLVIDGYLQLAAGNLITNDQLYLSETASIAASAAGTQILGRVHA